MNEEGLEEDKKVIFNSIKWTFIINLFLDIIAFIVAPLRLLTYPLYSWAIFLNLLDWDSIWPTQSAVILGMFVTLILNSLIIGIFIGSIRLNGWKKKIIGISISCLIILSVFYVSTIRTNLEAERKETLGRLIGEGQNIESLIDWCGNGLKNYPKERSDCFEELAFEETDPRICKNLVDSTLESDTEKYEEISIAQQYRCAHKITYEIIIGGNYKSRERVIEFCQNGFFGYMAGQNSELFDMPYPSYGNPNEWYNFVQCVAKGKENAKNFNQEVTHSSLEEYCYKFLKNACFARLAIAENDTSICNLAENSSICLEEMNHKFWF